MSINLAKALKTKNRLVGRLARLDKRITTENCETLRAGEEFHDDYQNPEVNALFEQRGVLVNALINLKSSISRSNQKIQPLLYKLAELKSEMKLYQSLNTTHGVVESHYREGGTTYVSTVKKQDVEDHIKRLEKEIDSIQDAIDTYNYTNTIEVEDWVLELAS